MATKYEARGADGQIHEIAPGQPFATHWVVGGNGPQAYDVSHPWNALDLYDANALARFGITATHVADPPGPVVRPELPKSTITARVDAVGKLDTVFAILNAQPILFAKWFSPDWPNVYLDDEGLLQVLAAAGCDADELALITAP